MLFQKIEDLPFPTLIFIQGRCQNLLLEFALVCKYRISHRPDSTYFCFTYQKYGLTSLTGGIYRLYIRIGLQATLDMILSCRIIKNKKAKHYGLIDANATSESLMNIVKALLLIDKTEIQSDHVSKNIAFKSISSNILTRPLIFRKFQEKIKNNTKSLLYSAHQNLCYITEIEKKKNKPNI